MIEYPKIETIYDRDPATHKVLPGKLRLPEFDLISRWLVTEKIDGTNIRVHLRTDGTVAYGGRTEAAQMPVVLVNFLRERLPPDLVASAFEPHTEAVIFGEGYGPKIQKGGGDYRGDVSFRVFDVAVISPERVWWLDWENVCDVATKLGVNTVPVLRRAVTLEEAVALVSGPSLAAMEDGGKGCRQEGVVARTDPLLLTRGGNRVCWKLKKKDFT